MAACKANFSESFLYITKKSANFLTSGVELLSYEKPRWFEETVDWFQYELHIIRRKSFLRTGFCEFTRIDLIMVFKSTCNEVF